MSARNNRRSSSVSLDTNCPFSRPARVCALCGGGPYSWRHRELCGPAYCIARAQSPSEDSNTANSGLDAFAVASRGESRQCALGVIASRYDSGLGIDKLKYPRVRRPALLLSLPNFSAIQPDPPANDRCKTSHGTFTSRPNTKRHINTANPTEHILRELSRTHHDLKTHGKAEPRRTAKGRICMCKLYSRYPAV